VVEFNLTDNLIIYRCDQDTSWTDQTLSQPPFPQTLYLYLVIMNHNLASFREK